MIMVMMVIILSTEGRIFSWGKSSRGRLGRKASSDDGCPSLVSVNAAAGAGAGADGDDDDDDDAGNASRDVHVTSLCCSHSVSLVCLTQRNVTLCSIFIAVNLLTD